jgi:hypothetical protein
VKLVLPILLTLVLTACGGGGGGGSASSNAASTSTSTVTTLNRVTALLGSEIKTMAVGDLTGDGLDDVVIGGWGASGSSTYIYVLVQNADGTLTDSTSTILPTNRYGGSQHVFIADFDGDGKKDIFFPGFSDGCNGNTTTCAVNSVVFWNSPGQFIKQTLPELTSAHGACFDDLDQDGDLDLIVAGGYNGSVGGVYINNGTRSFTLNRTILSNNYFSTCSVVHQNNGDIAILLGNNGQVAGSRSNISVFDNQLVLKSNIGVASSNTATDLINSMVIDNKFILVFNPMTAGDAGAKEIWNTQTYSYINTIDSSYNNQYYTYTVSVNGTPTVYFSGPNGDARLYQYSASAFIAYQQSRLTAMAAQAGGRPGVKDWSVDVGIIYQNSSTGKIYMLQSINSILYTQEL